MWHSQILRKTNGLILYLKLNEMKKIFSILISIALLQGCNPNVSETTTQLPPFSKYERLPISNLKPEGWIKTFLEYQRTGLTGHIDSSGFPFNTGMWTAKINETKDGIFWWPYEQTGYYVDGCIKAGYLLQDTFLLNKAKHQIYYTLEHPQDNGRLGPEHLIGRWNKWPYTGFFRSFMTEYEETHDSTLINAMHRHYLTYKAEDFQDELDICNLEEICWLFGITKDSTLLNMAESAYQLFKANKNNHDRAGCDLDFMSDRVPDYHGVVYIEIVKIPAILYSYTGKQEYLDEAIHGLQKMEKYDMLASGVPSTTEHFHGISEKAGHETCNVSTIPYTYGIMLQVTGNAIWADKIEKAVFNAGIGCVTKDFRAHQYFSAPNQMISTLNSNCYGYNPALQAFIKGHSTECCTGNVNRFMPYYSFQMWLRTKNNGIAAALYGPSEISAKLGQDNTPITIVENTKYPFDESVDFEIQTHKKAEFDFQVRIPGWCKNPEIALNGKKLDAELTPGTFYTIHRKFVNGDKITLTLPMQVSFTEWPNHGISVERGPIAYSYPIQDSVVIKKYSEDTHAKPYNKPPTEFTVSELYPKVQWNYALNTSDISNVEVVQNSHFDYPWSVTNVPVKLKLHAYHVKNWELFKPDNNKNDIEYYQTSAFPEKPDITDEDDTIELVPYGCTLLRVTVFPQAN